MVDLVDKRAPVTIGEALQFETLNPFTTTPDHFQDLRVINVKPLNGLYFSPRNLISWEFPRAQPPPKCHGSTLSFFAGPEGDDEAHHWPVKKRGGVPLDSGWWVQPL